MDNFRDFKRLTTNQSLSSQDDMVQIDNKVEGLEEP